MLIKVYITALRKFIQLSTRRYTHYKLVNWYSCPIWPWKQYFPCSYIKSDDLAVMGKYHSELLMLCNLAFLMKCK